MVFKKETAFEEVYKPYFKTHYAGKETKRYKMILAKKERLISFITEGTDFY